MIVGMYRVSHNPCPIVAYKVQQPIGKELWDALYQAHIPLYYLKRKVSYPIFVYIHQGLDILLSSFELVTSATRRVVYKYNIRYIQDKHM